MGVLFTGTPASSDFSPATLSPSQTVILGSSATPATPQPTPGSTGGAIQLTTVLAIVIGLVGFVVLVLAGSFISRLPCFPKSRSVPPPSPRARPRSHLYTRRDLYHHGDHAHAHRPPRPPIQHVEPTVATVFPFHSDDDPPYPLPPYEGPSPPPYSDASHHASQHIHVPPTAVVRA